MKKYRCIRCKKIFTTKRKYNDYNSKNICDKCLKPKGAKGQKPIHHYMKIKDMLKEEK